MPHGALPAFISASQGFWEAPRDLQPHFDLVCIGLSNWRLPVAPLIHSVGFCNQTAPICTHRQQRGADLWALHFLTLRLIIGQMWQKKYTPSFRPAFAPDVTPSHTYDVVNASLLVRIHLCIMCRLTLGLMYYLSWGGGGGDSALPALSSLLCSLLFRYCWDVSGNPADAHVHTRTHKYTPHERAWV